mmetsp:Transcript_50595/g.89013  ORF Transcript_50595/g.89013 Transcript_50595/m.89013 type:complete len:204 (-) Transcript_50595:241-852(-)
MVSRLGEICGLSANKSRCHVFVLLSVLDSLLVIEEVRLNRCSRAFDLSGNLASRVGCFQEDSSSRPAVLPRVLSGNSASLLEGFEIDSSCRPAVFPRVLDDRLEFDLSRSAVVFSSRVDNNEPRSEEPSGSEEVVSDELSKSPEVLREPVSSEPPSSDLAPNDGLLSEGLLKRPGLFALSNDPDAPVCRGDPESDELSKRVEL